MLRGGVVIVAALAAVAGALACDRGPSAAELAAWRAEAQRENAARFADRARAGTKPWTIEVDANGKQTILTWAELEKLATTHVHTKSPHRPPYPDALVDFRGVRVSDLLDRVGVNASATPASITFVAQDSFRCVIDSADARAYPIILAIEHDGHPTLETEGGPIYLVFPHEDVPALREKYPDRFWCFYVTHVIPGTEAAAVTVGGSPLDAAALDALPQRSITEKSHFRGGWPRDALVMTGPSLADVAAAAHLDLANARGVRLIGKPATERNPKDPFVIDKADLADAILVTHWGDDHAPVDSAMGGPVLLAFPLTAKPALAERYPEKYWMTFVQEIAVEPAAGGTP